jgi:multimeric flavodoxin WrbA
MKITILNGNQEPSTFDSYLDQLETALETAGHAVTHTDLRDLPLRHCVGCWGCWVRTPG